MRSFFMPTHLLTSSLYADPFPKFQYKQALKEAQQNRTLCEVRRGDGERFT